MPTAQTIAREFDFSIQDFHFVARLLKSHTGIELADHKADMVYARLASRVRTLGLNAFGEYIALLERDGDEIEMGHLVNALTTNHTSFFRERGHFDHFHDIVVPESLALFRKGAQSRIRFWSAGCSTGEEPYSMAMTLRDCLGGQGRLDVRILATDLDSDVLETAKTARYPGEEFGPAPKGYRKRFATLEKDGDSDAWTIKDAIRSLVSFKRLNLLHDWPMAGPFDAIFCRNVMIYFDAETTRRLIDRFADMLRPGGWLYLGHAETIVGKTNRFERMDVTTYRKADPK